MSTFLWVRVFAGFFEFRWFEKKERKEMQGSIG